MSFPDRKLSFVLASTNHGSMIVNRNDINRNGLGEPYGVGYQIFDASHCEGTEIALLLELLNLRRRHFGDGVVAIDGGANIGTQTVEWARHMHGWGRVISFEAQEMVYYALAGNIVLNNCLNARAVHGALGERMGQLHVPKPDYHSNASFGSIEIGVKRTTEEVGQDVSYAPQDMAVVPMVNIDTLKLDRLDLIKLDVEGMEEEVLRGSEKKISAHKPIMYIETLKSDADEISRFLTAREYKLIKVGINLLGFHRSDPCRHDVTHQDGNFTIK